MNAPNNLLADHLDGSLSYSVAAHMKKLKQEAKSKADRLSGLQSQKKESETVPAHELPR